MKIFQPIVTGSFTTSGSVFLKGLTSAAQSNVVIIDTATGQLYTTASSALGGGGGGGTGNGFPFTGTAQITGSLIVTDTIEISGSLQDYYVTNTGAPATWALFTQVTGSYTSAFVKYTVSNGANTRAGEFITTWNGTTIVSYDNSTTDIGNTTDVTILAAIATDTVEIKTTILSSGWKIKALATFI
jgi:hypothetical protein